jgi:hypothetical protein
LRWRSRRCSRATRPAGEVALAVFHDPAGEVRDAFDGAQLDPVIGGGAIDRRGDRPVRLDREAVEAELSRL